jgi:hypothetical protein
MPRTILSIVAEVGPWFTLLKTTLWVVDALASLLGCGNDN